MQRAEKTCFLIRSIREDGQRFRPSDWAERLSAGAASYGHDRRLRFDERLKPTLIEGEKCLFVSGDLACKEPELYDDLLRFASRNGLPVEQASCESHAA